VRINIVCKFTCNDFEEIVKECKGCEYIFKRIYDNKLCCSFSIYPSCEWFWFKDLGYPCSRATHIPKK